MDGFKKGGPIGHMGVKRVMGHLTESQIVDFYELQARDGFAAEAIDELSRMEKKPVETIIAIIEKSGMTVRKGIKNMSRSLLSPEERQNLLKERREGSCSVKQLAERYGISSQQVSNILSAERKKTHSMNEDVQDESGNDNMPGTDIELSVPVNWSQTADRLSVLAELLTGSDIEIISKKSSESKGRASIVFITADGKRLRIKAKVY